ncbi:DUF2523 domain-containing protein [Variovorax sp. DXTD-1]|uniref:DUF2523 domain-containing protein n=1 Tax=Variovorax sp. DXTD-1 TaxID=2495592 RepID=UPI000F86FC57|nr:DUF2523 domain-containing protein [Variovorax sp. DXTD-1]RST50548.1 DUF2523 domain-containing protein [Variovorax sp. DXTD-1]
MPAIIALLLRGLLWVSGSIAGQVLLRLGIGVVTFTGANASLAWLKSQAVSALQGMGGEYVALLSHMKVGVCISIITSAIVARAVMQGITSDIVKRWVVK